MGAERIGLFLAACLAAIPLSLLAAQLLGAAVLPFHGTALSFAAEAALAGLATRCIARSVLARYERWSAPTLFVLGALAIAGIAAWFLMRGAS